MQAAAAKDSKADSIIMGAFKGMGDLISAAPVVISELNSGMRVSLLVFPAVAKIVDLLDWGDFGRNLEVLSIPDKTSVMLVIKFLCQMSRLSPSIVWVSPHAPTASRSWRVPLTLWIFRKCFWRTAKLAGAESERLGRYFDISVPVDRTLPLAIREWTAYSMIRRPAQSVPPQTRFRPSLQRSRQLSPLFDVLIHPGANADNRKWPMEHFVELIGLIPQRYRVGIAGLPKDVEILRAAMPADRSVDFIVGTLEDAIIGIARARVLLSMDSGTTVFAACLRVPTVALYGPVDPISVIRPDDGIFPIYERKWSCQPCGDSSCKYSLNYCMRAINPATVARELLRVLRKAGEETTLSD